MDFTFYLNKSYQDIFFVVYNKGTFFFTLLWEIHFFQCFLWSGRRGGQWRLNSNRFKTESGCNKKKDKKKTVCKLKTKNRLNIKKKHQNEKMWVTAENREHYLKKLTQEWPTECEELKKKRMNGDVVYLIPFLVIGSEE